MTPPQSRATAGDALHDSRHLADAPSPGRGAGPEQQMVVHLTGHVLAIDAPSVRSGPTKRPAVAVLWSKSGKPFRLSNFDNGCSWSGQAAVVAPHFVRSTHADDCGLISLNFEAGHPYFSVLAALARGGLLPLDLRRVKAFTADLSQAIASNGSDALDRLTTEIAKSLLFRERGARRIEGRVAAVVERLELELATPPSIAELARWVHLSEDRLSHLFAAEVGLPVRSYVVWRRYRRALASLRWHNSLTKVAHTVGFYDHAQMTRTFVGFLGYQPSLLRKEEFIRVIGQGAWQSRPASVLGR